MILDLEQLIFLLKFRCKPTAFVRWEFISVGSIGEVLKFFIIYDYCFCA